MTQYIITSDIHIGNYTNYNFRQDFRKNQFIDLARRFVREGIEKNIDTIIILGDFLVVPNPSQYELNILYEFLNILKGQFKSIKYILGQHDLAVRNNIDSETNTVIRLFGLEYVHQKTEEIEGLTIAYSDYIWEGGVNVPDCDIYLSHITLSMDSRFQGQEIKTNKRLKLGIAGDIHTKIDTKINGIPFYSCNVPLQNNFGDSREPSFIILSLDRGSFKVERIPTETEEFKPLKLLYSYEVNDDNVAYEPKVVVSKFHNKEIEDKEAEHIQSIKKLSTFENIDQYIEDREIADLIRKSIDYSSSYDIDLNFKIKELEVHNFRSIQDFTYKAEDGITLLLGMNGSGKSSLIDALHSVFRPHKYIKNYMRTGTDDTYVALTFQYKGKEYMIQRGVGGTQFSIDRQPQELKQREIENLINETFSFIPYIEMLFINSNNQFFISNNRYAILCLLFRIDVLQTYIDTINNLMTEYKATIKDLNNHLTYLKGVISGININPEYLDKELKEEIDYKSLEDRKHKQEIYDINYKNLMEDLERYNFTNGDELKIEELEKKIEDIRQRKSDNELKINTLKTAKNNLLEKKKEKEKLLKDNICSLCGTVLEAVSDEVKERVGKEIKDIEVQINEMNSRIDEVLQDKMPNTQEFIVELDKLKTKKNKHAKTIEDINKLVNPNENIEELTNNIQIIKEKNKEIQEYNLLVKQAQESKKKLQDITTDITTTTEKIDKQTDIRGRLEIVLSSLDMSDSNSITSQLLRDITENMSNDKIKYKLVDGEITVSMNVGGNWLAYETLSTGQRLIVDVMSLSMVSKYHTIGLLTIDESMSFLDEVNIIHVTDLLKESQINHIIVAGQSERFSHLVKNEYRVTLENKISKYNLVKRS